MAKKTKTPEGLDGLWDEDTETAWKALNDKQQKFLQAYLTNGNNGTQAYRTVYNELASDDVASSSAVQLFRSIHIGVFLDKLADTNKYDLLAAKKVYKEGMAAFKPVWNPEKDSALDVEDHKIRKDCADSLMKLNGEYIERTENVNKNIDVPVDLTNLSDEDLKKLAEIQEKIK